MTPFKRTVLGAAVVALVLGAGCGQTNQMDRNRAEATDRWQSSRADMAVRLAEGCYDRGEAKQAQQHVDEALRNGVRHPAVYVLAARLAAERGELDAALGYAQTARSLAPGSADAVYCLATVEHALGRRDEALALFEEASRLDPKRPAFVLAESELLVAVGRPEDAARCLGDAIGRMPAKAEINAALGDVLNLLGRHRAAAESYEIALRLDPQRRDVKPSLATALYAAGAYDEAEPVLADLVETEPEFAGRWALKMRAECLMALGRTAEARATYERLQALSPQEIGPVLALARCDLLMNRLGDAEHRLRAVLASDPRHAEANALLGCVLLSAGRRDEAAAYLKKALEDPTFEGRRTIEGLLAQADGRSQS